MLKQLRASRARVVVGQLSYRICASQVLRQPVVFAAAAAAATPSPAAASLSAPLHHQEQHHHRQRLMATQAAAAAPPAAAPEQHEVRLHPIAKSAAVLRDFEQRFAPADGFRVELSPAPLDADLDAAAFSSALATRELGHVTLSAPSMASTQEFMRRHAATLPPGAVCVAARQTSGRGRGGNQWTSPDGCLMFTAARRLQVPGSQAPFINYVVCLAVVRGIADALAPWLKVRACVYEGGGSRATGEFVEDGARTRCILLQHL